MLCPDCFLPDFLCGCPEEEEAEVEVDAWEHRWEIPLVEPPEDEE
jgi:hypothetical protein